jgi:SAM-dependent methyltransferase
MGWYDLFSRFYDSSLEPLYRDARTQAADALHLEAGHSVLDMPTGTGQSLDALAPRVLPGGRVVGVDRSAGMLTRARARAEAAGFSHVTLLQADVHALDEARPAAPPDAPSDTATMPGRVDRLHIFLGLSAFPRWEEAFAALWARLAPGGRCVIVDVHADPLGFQGRMVNLVARADIRRETWAPLQRAGVNYTKVDLASKKEHGGQLFLAAADKPG